jgi:hypothetical protein
MENVRFVERTAFNGADFSVGKDQVPKFQAITEAIINRFDDVLAAGYHLARTSNVAIGLIALGLLFAVATHHSGGR